MIQNDVKEILIKALQDTNCCECEKEKMAREKQGEWIIVDDCENFIAKCNKCNKIIDSRCLKPKCPYCGRKMINYV